MWIDKHILLGIVPTIILAYYENYLFAILFFLTNTFVDVDHIISMSILDKTLNLRKIYNTFKEIQYNGLKKYEERTFCTFHTVEFLIITGVVSCYFSIFVPIFCGLVFHVVTDAITVGRGKRKRIFFLTFYVIKYLKGGYK